MINKPINRRRFLQTSGVAVAIASTGMLIAPDGAWALSLAALDDHTARTLMAMARQLYPHPTLGDMYYAKVAEDLDLAAKADPALAKQLKDGVATLDRAMHIRWLDLSEGNQLRVLAKAEKTPFFQTVRSTTIVSLYNNPLVWRHFGYEGPSFPFGGYRERGFDDLAWLPNPPAAASPPVK